MLTLPTTQEMFKALVRKDPAFDGVFIVGVKTTGVFCRPTCSAKKPRRENVEFFSSARDALHAGYRACKRCRPLDNGETPPTWVRTLMNEVDRAPTERLTSADLRRLSIEPSRAARWFKQHYGMTFQAYHRARRMGQALAEIRSGRDTTRAALTNGYGSPSGFRSAFDRLFGCPPGSAKGIECLLARWIDTPLGAMLAAATEEGLCLLEFVDRRMLQTQLATVRRRFNAAIVPGNNAHLEAIGLELDLYFAGKLRQFATPVVLRGSEFQLQVWRRLMEIPYGETTSYAHVARKVGAPNSSRAVGRANGDNRLAIIIPCHRVVRADGSLCGYGGGLWRKKWLLEHERGKLGADS